MDGFTHLHVHSHYSLLDGGATVGALVKQAKSLGMGSLALSDHGNLYGAVEFYRACREADIRPIMAMEAYISPTHRGDRDFRSMRESSYHLLLLATNNAGWRNLMRLSSLAFQEGFYYRPRVDLELLSEYNEGLICTSACLGGHIPSALLAGDEKTARKVAEDYIHIFGPDRFFMELQNQGIEEQSQVNPLLADLAGSLGVGLVGTNDVHFLARKSKSSHEVLCCISTGKTLDDPGHLAEAYTDEMYLKSAEEMRDALARWPEACDNTQRIAEMCEVELDFDSRHLPVFATPAGKTDDDYLRELAMDGLARRVGQDPPAEYVERLEWELKVIADKGFSSYFLIVHDFVQFARDNDIPCSPRGSGVATLLGYVLGIADVDPLKYGLLFERFTDPQREEAPDLDIDICQEGRAKVIEYVRQKYGYVAQIITYGTLKARAAIRDVGRVLNVPLPEVDRIAKKVPEGPKVTLEKALASEPDLREMVEKDPTAAKLFEHARQLEGLARHAGVHACGVVIASEPLEGIIPLCRQSDSEDAITQWDGPTCDRIGLMKMDFLGLRTLTIIQRARELVRKNHGKDVDPEQLPLDDESVFELFRRGKTAGVFQFESGGMRDLLQKMKPNRIQDLIAANAMYRPGPMELIPSYCARKNGQEPVPSVHELVDDILAETYGIMVYQEQVMQVLNRLGKLPLNRALTLIKAISKKKEKTIAGERPNFLAGCKDNGIAEDEAQQLFDLILKFAGYGFNKAHSTRYAIVAYQSAYFKRYYPKEFLAATLTYEAGDSDKLSQYLDEAVAMDVPVGPPDINASESDFTVVGESVRFGLAAVKGVGAKAVEEILRARNADGPFEDLYDFCERIDQRAVNRACIEALIKCGAMDKLGPHRGAMFAAVDGALKLGQSRAADRKAGQMSFFDAFAAEAPEAKPGFPNVEPWTETFLLAAEKETLGFYITSHPLTSYGRELKGLSSHDIRGIQGLQEGQPVVLGCMISQIRPKVVKQGRSAGQRMAMLTVEDMSGQCDCVVFASTYANVSHLLTDEAMVYLIGSVDRRRETPSVIVNEVIPLEDGVEDLTGSIRLKLGLLAEDDAKMAQLRELLAEHKGPAAVVFGVRPLSQPEYIVWIEAGRKWSVKPSRDLMDALIELLDEENVVFKGKPASSFDTGRRRNNKWSQRTAPAAQQAPASEAVTRFN